MTEPANLSTLRSAPPPVRIPGSPSPAASALWRGTLEKQIETWKGQRERLASEINEQLGRLQDLDSTIAGAADQIARIEREAIMRQGLNREG